LLLGFNPRPRRGAGALVMSYQPIPAPAGFNPRPRRGAGAQKRGNFDVMNPRFQSSPAPRRGRSISKLPLQRILMSFNPRPRRGAGAPTAGTVDLRGINGFNPRPRRGAGAPGAVFGCDSHLFVSILARAEARALAPPKSGCCAIKRFNPRPRRGAGAPC